MNPAETTGYSRLYQHKAHMLVSMNEQSMKLWKVFRTSPLVILVSVIAWIGLLLGLLSRPLLCINLLHQSKVLHLHILQLFTQPFLRTLHPYFSQVFG